MEPRADAGGPPANWYPDPHTPLQLRYWDGTQWTTHVAPAIGAATQPRTGRLGSGAIAGIVIGAVALGIVVIGVLAAIAIPVFLNQKHKEADADATASLQTLANAIATDLVDNPYQLPTAIPSGSQTTGMTVQLDGGDGTPTSVQLRQHIAFGGLVGDPESWCVWVSVPRGTQTVLQYSTWGGVEPGSCSP